MTEKDTRKEIMRRATELKATVQIGKGGMDQGLRDEIWSQLKNRRILKIKVLDNSGGDVETLSRSIAEENDAVVVDVRGNVMVITDKRTWNSLSQKKF